MAFRITGKIQHYAWGGYDFIPHLLHIQNASHQPFAEYWLGAHDKASAEVALDDKTLQPLNQLIKSSPEKFLGEKITKTFGRLPFLFKVLDVKDMLSIQVHPTKEEAEKGFARENAAGIPVDAPHRNYKDDNHKPEMMAALSEFYLLHGFRQEDSLRGILNNTPELRSLYSYFDKKGYEALYAHVMNMPSFRSNELLQPLLNRVLPLYKQKQLSKESPDFWAARAVDSHLTNPEHPDKGIFSIYFFNLVHLYPGEGIFQAAGVPHAYLEGQNVELMANSDNVLRGGLTPKHVDVSELLKHIRFEGIKPAVIQNISPGKNDIQYPSSAPDFSLSKLVLNNLQHIDNQSMSPEIILVITGEISLSANTETALKSGESAYILPGETYRITSIGKSLIYKASVPVQEM
ncbi:MAG: mannose-6-phosphate isomerase, class I [Chitinophagaceae bacterium]|nr:MAG: mannose-6-phosphate isomerase, class I [Chitinophagaceae bacterium]